MPRVRVAIRLRFTKLPNVTGERVFKDALTFAEPEDCSYQDLSDLVEKKLTFMEVPPSDFTVLFREDNGDLVVVDTAYFSELLQQWKRTAEQTRMTRPLQEAQNPFTEDENSRGSGHSGSSESVLEAAAVTFEVEVNKIRSLVSLDGGLSGELAPVPTVAVGGVASPVVPGTVGGPVARQVPLTAENLAKATLRLTPPVIMSGSDTLQPTTTGPLASPSSSPFSHVFVGDLTCPPASPSFLLRCVVLAVRFKMPRPDVTVAEIDLCDAVHPSQQITAVTFDATVQKAIRENLRSDHRQVVELSQLYVRRKNDVDRRFQTNAHPLLLRMDRGSRITVIRILPVPVALQPEAVVTVSDTAQRTTSVVNLCDLVGTARGSPGSSLAHLAPTAAFPLSGGSTSNSCSGVAPALAAASSSSSSSHSGGQRRTVFSFVSGGGSSGSGGGGAPVAGVIPSLLGQQLRSQQEQYVNRRPVEEELPFEPGVPHVTRRDVRQREPLVEQHTNKEVLRKERIRRRVEVSQTCLLCGLNCEEEEACMAKVRRLLEASSRNRGKQIPTIEALKAALSDRRGVPPGKTPTRLLSQATFVDLVTKSVHTVHIRCAHLCTSYQSGKDLEDFVLCELNMQVCTLCGLPGATVSCYHPDCNEMYHTVCALYSGGYVNFGKKDPYLPCPACPRHTQVVVSTSRKQDVLLTDPSCWEDGIAFDSRVVESTDLRDPDQNGGE